MLRPSCLFMVEDWPLSRTAAGGAAALNFSHLELLIHSDVSVDLLILKGNPSKGFEDYCEQQPETWEQVKSWCRSYQLLSLIYQDRPGAPFKHLLNTLIDPFYLHAAFSPETLDGLRKLIHERKPAFIWAEHLVPALAVLQTGTNIPIVYGHHDWQWRIKQYRAGQKSARNTLKFALTRRMEHLLARRAAACVSGSATELKEIKGLGVSNTLYLPTTYEAYPLPENIESSDPPRIVHLGGMNTTANRIGLERFLEVVWPHLVTQLDNLPELWIIGSLDGASDKLLSLIKESGAITTGFVPDLDTVMRPFDIHIIPWEYNTGTRTRIPLVLNYSQILVSTKAAAACAPELDNGRDCLLVEHLADMTSVLASLMDSPERCRAIALAGRETFLNHFTREALQPRFNDFISSLG